MKLTLRPGTIDDARECGRIYFEAFKSITDQHSFPPDPPTIDIGTSFITTMLSHPKFYSVIAELDGKMAGCIFLDERSVIAGLALLFVAPHAMNSTIGKQLIQIMKVRATQQRFSGARGTVNAWHFRALALYIKLGGTCRESLSVMQGKPLNLRIPGYHVRPAQEADFPACNQLCYQIHGHDRAGELYDAISQSCASIVEHQGRITGYSTGMGSDSHAVGEGNDDLKAMIGAAQEFTGQGFYVPSCNGDLFRWCLNHGLRVVNQTILVTIGLYNEPIGAYLPSSSY